MADIVIRKNGNISICRHTIVLIFGWPTSVKLEWHCLEDIFRHKFSYKMTSKGLANFEYSPSYGQKTVDLIKITILTVFWP
jgi:hypothetical protein